MLSFKIVIFHLVIWINVSSVFSGLIAHCFLALNNIPLSEFTTVYLSTHLLRDIQDCFFWTEKKGTELASILGLLCARCSASYLDMLFHIILKQISKIIIII